MKVWVIALLVAFAGCAEPGTEEETASIDEADTAPANETVEGAQNASLESFTILVSVDNGTAGEPFNFTIETDLAPADALNASWTVDVFDADAAVNATDNATTPTALTTATGMGLPATSNLTLDAGNFTLAFTASLVNHADATASHDLALEAGQLADATPPAPFVFEGSGSGQGIAGLGFCDTGDKDFQFTLEAQYKAMVFTMDADDSDTGGDFDWTIKGPGGESHFSDAIGNESPKKFDAPTPGGWTLTVHCYSAWMEVPYTVTATIE